MAKSDPFSTVLNLAVIVGAGAVAITFGPSLFAKLKGTSSTFGPQPATSAEDVQANQDAAAAWNAGGKGLMDDVAQWANGATLGTSPAPVSAPTVTAQQQAAATGGVVVNVNDNPFFTLAGTDLPAQLAVSHD